jgi:squalene-hopene/tetraprenyl-beta-curcumene cyclase
VGAAGQGRFLDHKTWLLWASIQLEGLMMAQEREQTIKELLALQCQDGGWNLPSLGAWKRQDGEPNDKDAPSDGYATGLIVYVLRQTGPADQGTDPSRSGLAQDPPAGVGALVRAFAKCGPGTNAGTALAVMALKSCEGD